MIQLGDTWIRSSQIESIKGVPYTQVHGPTLEEVTVRLVSGRTVEARMEKGGAKDIARKAIGL